MFNKKVDKIKCPICNSDDIKVALKLESPLGGLWDIYACGVCVTQFIHPIPSSEVLHQFYNQSYHENIERRKRLTNPAYGRMTYRRQWAIIKGLLNRRHGKVLDFGCGGGHFLDNAGAGWEKYGVELSEKARGAATGKGIKVFTTLEEMASDDEFVDVVTMFAAIEHLPNPKEVVRELARVLKRDGLLVIMTGDVKSLKSKLKGKKWHMYRPPEHVYFFCAQSLDLLMNSLGFRKVKILYTDGGMTHIPSHPLNILLRAGLMILERIPILKSLALFDHNYSYYKKIS